MHALKNAVMDGGSQQHQIIKLQQFVPQPGCNFWAKSLTEKY